MSQTIAKPQPGEYAPYAIMYIDLVPDDGQLLTHLSQNLQTVTELARSFPVARLTAPCGPGEWTIQEILVHIMDTERVFAYRTLRLARGDRTVLPGFAENDYAAASRANERTLADILTEYEAVRQASVTLLGSFAEEIWTRTGSASGNPLSVRGAAFQIAGHELHHLYSIRENYL
ncbi:MAG: DinB family protein [Anaerolineales bacterium]|nr:DinB family protein [Anaerolineales bacterium]MCB8959897.1 DinB family protein [Ardenticatenales bacterium]